MKPRDILLAMSVPLIWGLGFTFTKAALGQFPPLLLMALCFTLTALVLVWFVRPPFGMMRRNAVAGLVGAANGRPAEAPETRLLTAALIGQCMALGAARRVVWARLDWDDYTPERVDFVISTMVPAVLAMFGLPDVEEGPQ